VQELLQSAEDSQAAAADSLGPSGVVLTGPEIEHLVDVLPGVYFHRCFGSLGNGVESGLHLEIGVGHAGSDGPFAGVSEVCSAV
jgi:hypothetical protein